MLISLPPLLTHSSLASSHLSNHPDLVKVTPTSVFTDPMVALHVSPYLTFLIHLALGSTPFSTKFFSTSSLFSAQLSYEHLKISVKNELSVFLPKPNCPRLFHILGNGTGIHQLTQTRNSKSSSVFLSSVSMYSVVH